MTDAGVLRVAVVGHTNTGKTSLLRTITRDRTFGDVLDCAGTTRQVQAAAVPLKGREVLIWYDTPGLEDSMALYDWIEQLSQPGQRLDGPDRIALFLEDKKARQRFEQEYRVLSQIMVSDAMLYVVDVRDPVLAKHRDELHLLQMCAKPVLPVLNFIASESALAQPWIQAFARQGIHIYLAFDSVTPPSDGEALLYDTLAQLLGSAKTTFQGLSKQAQASREQRRRAALEVVAQLCVKTAAVKKNLPQDKTLLQTALEQQQALIRRFESESVADLLRLYAFAHDDYTATELPITDGQWQTDLFSKQALTEAGISLGKGAAIGALAGAAVDVLSAGLTLGAGTLAGAAAGSVWQGVDQWGSHLKAKLSGQVQWRVSDEVLRVLAVRNLQLIRALEKRGHAAQRGIEVVANISKKRTVTLDLPFETEPFEQAMAKARSHPEWSDELSSDRVRRASVQAVAHCFAGSTLFVDDPDV